MSGVLAGLVLVLMVAAVAPVTLLSGHWGVLPFLVTADTRARFRGMRPREAQKSARWPARLKRAVDAADRNRCAYCGISRAELAARGRMMHRDHIYPWKYGGITCLWNAALLCDRHNEIKRAYFVRRDGSVYRGLSGREAPRILAAELARRRSPARLARGLLALAA